MQEMTWIEFIGSWIMLIGLVILFHRQFKSQLPITRDIQRDVTSCEGVTDGEEK